MIDPGGGEAPSLIERLHRTFEDTPWGPLRLARTADAQARIEVDPALQLGLLRRLRDAPRLGMQRLVDLSAIDFLGAPAAGEARFVLVYSLHAPATHDRLRVHVPLAQGGTPAGSPGDRVDGGGGDGNGGGGGDGDFGGEAVSPPTIDSVVSLWPAARWLEREVFDLFGIRFRGHPDLRRILLEPGFVGAPLRKDHPLEPATPSPPPPEWA